MGNTYKIIMAIRSFASVWMVAFRAPTENQDEPEGVIFVILRELSLCIKERMKDAGR